MFHVQLLLSVMPTSVPVSAIITVLATKPKVHIFWYLLRKFKSVLLLDLIRRGPLSL